MNIQQIRPFLTLFWIRGDFYFNDYIFHFHNTWIFKVFSSLLLLDTLWEIILVVCRKGFLSPFYRCKDGEPESYSKISQIDKAS